MDNKFRLIPTAVPPARRRAPNKYEETVATFVVSGYQSALVKLEDISLRSAVPCLRSAVARSYPGQVRVVQRQGEVYLQRDVVSGSGKSAREARPSASLARAKALRLVR